MLYVLAVVCPPFAALLAGKPKQAGLNLVLTLCLWVPGVVHAFMVLTEAKRRHDNLHEHETDSEKVLSYRVPRVL